MTAKKRTKPEDPAPPPSHKPARKTSTPRPAKTEAPLPASTRAARPKAPAAPRQAKRTTAPAATGTTARSRERGLRIVMVSSEAHPFAKTGGLAEVVGALPAALARLGHTVTIVVPRYQGVAARGDTREFSFDMGIRTITGRFHTTTLPEGVRAVLLDVPEFFDRPGLYGADGADYPDNALRFAALSRGAIEYVRSDGQRPDVIHAHDWQAGLVPVYQKMRFAHDPLVGGVPAVFTIHNLAFQGVFPAHVLEAVGLTWELLHPEALEYWGNISFLKGGVNFSEKITTVSPTYAREILMPEYGFGFEGVLQRRAPDLIGILNGIDVARWNPESDALVPASYSAANLDGKREAKKALLRHVRMPADEAALARPVIGLISRLTDQKGFDLIGAAAAALMELDATWVMLGSGERHYEDLWRAMASRHPDRVSATIGFDEQLAHLIEAGADIFLMPSRFEPCGLNQLYSLRYGTVPVVRATGGLKDTVRDAEEPGGTGVVFTDYTPSALLGAVSRALELFKDTTRWQGLQRAGMARDPSWDASAREYVKVYRGLSHGI